MCIYIYVIEMYTYIYIYMYTLELFIQCSWICVLAHIGIACCFLLFAVRSRGATPAIHGSPGSSAMGCAEGWLDGRLFARRDASQVLFTYMYMRVYIYMYAYRDMSK